MKKLILFLFIVHCTINLAYSQGNWFWQNPSCSAWGSQDVFFVNQNTGWIVSYAGTVMKTTNGGVNFVDQIIDFDGTLLGVHFFDVNSGYVFGAGGTFYKTTNSGINWTKIPNTIGQYLSDCHFFDINTGWICGYNGTIVKTTNGGYNWTTYTSGVTSILNSINFLNANTGITGGAGNSLLKTTNAGLNWFSVVPPGTIETKSLCYASTDTIYLGTTGGIMRSVNGGANWTQQTLPATMTIYSIKFFENAKTGIINGCGGMSTYVMKTTNGGENWQTLYTGPAAQSIHASFPNSNNILCAGTKSTVGVLVFYSSTNSGLTWNNYSSNYYFSQTANTIYFINENTGFACSSFNGLHKTTNGGNTWINDTIHINSEYLDIKFINQSTGFVCGSSRVILKTTDCGLNWEQVNHEYNPSGLGTLSFPSETVGYAFGSELIKKTTNGGTNWFNIQTSAYAYNSGCFINDTTGWSCYQGNIIKTTNGGMNWNTVYSGGGVFYDLEFANSDTGWVCGTGRNIGLTTNGGLNWIAIYTGQTGTNCYLSDLEFINSKTGFVSGSGGFLAYTTNSGVNWSKQSVHMGSYQILSTCFINSSVGWIAGYAGFIKKTTNSGWTSGTFNFSRSGLNKPILDNQCTYDTIIVANDNPLGFTGDINLKIENIIHTNDDDLEISLIHQGITDTVVYRVGGSGDNFIGTVLDEDAEINISNGTAPFSGIFKPSKPLSQFINTNPGGMWILRIYDRAAGNTGTLNAWGFDISISNTQIIVKNISKEVPHIYSLEQNYPNPFNQSSIIEFQCPINGIVELKIFDLLGRGVAVLVNEILQPGTYQVNFNAENLSSGVYFYQLKTDNFIETKKLILIK